MIQALVILFGAGFTVATACALGAMLFRKLALALEAWEERLLSFVVGSACLSAIVFVLCAAKLVHRGVVLLLGLALIGYAGYSGALRFSGKPFPPLPRLWRWVFVLAFAAFTYLAFFHAMMPENSPDGMAYHLGTVFKYQRAHGFTRITTDFYSSLSEGVELLFLYAFVFGRHSAAALVHFAFLVCLALLILSYGRRIGQPLVGVAGAIFTYACPIVYFDGSMAYIDVALGAVLFAEFYLLQVWDENRDPKLFIPIGILAGFGYAVKYTGFVAVPYAIGFIAWKLWRARKPVLRPVAIVALLSAAFILPWMLKNWIEVANPVSPLANRWFPNPYVHISFEDNWRQYLGRYDLASNWQIPLQVTVQGDHVEGFLGPLFLLTPLALLALRLRAGRQLLLAAALFGSTYFSNIGTRFLIPVVPFISLALALAISDFPGLLLALVMVHAISCWPPVTKLYTSPGGWGLEKVSVRAALRRQPEEAYLSQTPDYNAARLIERVVPPGGQVFEISQSAQSYTTRDLLVGYESASNEVLQDILWTPVIRDFQPTRRLKFQFAPREIRKLRVVQTASVPMNQWSVAELRVFAGALELPRDPAWRLTARPNPWEVQLAFDNSPVTRWRSWQPAQPGMYIEVDFGRLQTADALVVETSVDSANTKIKLEGLDAQGQWNTLSEHPEESPNPIRTSLRRAAAAEFKARGIRYVLMKPENPGADDLRRYGTAWGTSLAGVADPARLYFIQ
jgi:4-amino-4-deoxy-L-arabinose transferase-like glycosyltransferase